MIKTLFLHTLLFQKAGDKNLKKKNITQGDKNDLSHKIERTHKIERWWQINLSAGETLLYWILNGIVILFHIPIWYIHINIVRDDLKVQ